MLSGTVLPTIAVVTPMCGQDIMCCLCSCVTAKPVTRTCKKLREIYAGIARSHKIHKWTNKFSVSDTCLYLLLFLASLLSCFLCFLCLSSLLLLTHSHSLSTPSQLLTSSLLFQYVRKLSATRQFCYFPSGCGLFVLFAMALTSAAKYPLIFASTSSCFTNVVGICLNLLCLMK